MTSDDTERAWKPIWCLLFGHNDVGHTAYRLTSDTGRTLYGDLCKRCGRFKPSEDGKERFNNPMPTSVEAALRDCQEDTDT